MLPRRVLYAGPVPLIGGDYDAVGMCRWIDGLIHDYGADRISVFIERAQAMPRQGVRSMFNYGAGYGLWLGILSHAGLPYAQVPSAAWTRVMLAGQPGDGKARAIVVCRRRWRDAMLVPVGCRRPHDGVADALLIAEYGALSTGSHFKTEAV